MTGYNPLVEVAVMGGFMAVLLVFCWFAIRHDRKKAEANQPRGATRL